MGLDPVVLSQCLRFGTKAAQKKTLPRYLIVLFFSPFCSSLARVTGSQSEEPGLEPGSREVTAVGPS